MTRILQALRVLIVEDKQHMRLLLRALLSAAGVHEVCEANNGADGLTLLAERPRDLVLLDLAMEPMDGLEFTRTVRAGKKPHCLVPIIVISGYTEQNRVAAARDAGVSEFLAKPITSKSLFARMDEILARPRRFVHHQNYCGPDRRRKPGENYRGPRRRSDDLDDLVLVPADTKAPS
ncbi:MAG: response regulator [Rhizomicrobium sp.]